MGTLRNTDATYYLADGDHGNYRYLSLSDIIDSFSATYVGKNKLCEAVDMSDISFHAIRALQELSYDTLRSKKDLPGQLDNAPSYAFVMCLLIMPLKILGPTS